MSGKLTVRKFTTAKPGRYGNGDDLYLKVEPSGSRRRELRVTVAGKRRDFGLGGHKDISLVAVREKAAVLGAR